MSELEGKPVPAFDMPTADGDRVSDGALKGQPYVLYFYPKDDTSGCTLEAVEFTRLKSDFDAIGVPVFGVSPDPVKKHGKFRDKHELGIPLLSDAESDVCERYGVWKEKKMYGKTFMGIERSTFLIDADGKIARVWPKVKVDGHVAEVLDAVRAL